MSGQKGQGEGFCLVVSLRVSKVIIVYHENLNEHLRMDLFGFDVFTKETAEGQTVCAGWRREGAMGSKPRHHTGPNVTSY